MKVRPRPPRIGIKDRGLKRVTADWGHEGRERYKNNRKEVKIFERKTNPQTIFLPKKR